MSKTRTFTIMSPKYGEHEVTVDEEDYARVCAAGPWHIHARPKRHTVYAKRNVRSGEFALLHNLLLGFKGVDHINGNGLDNRKENLRPATDAQNKQNLVLSFTNRSGYRGVSWDRFRGKWKAQARVNGKNRSFGRFDTVEEAAQAIQKVRASCMPFSADARELA